MKLDLEFYTLAANLVPVLLVALAVERFGNRSNDNPVAAQRASFVALGFLILSESLSLGVLAQGERSDLTDATIIGTLGFGLVALASAYANLILEANPTTGTRHWWQALPQIFGLVLAVSSPTVLIFWFAFHDIF